MKISQVAFGLSRFAYGDEREGRKESTPQTRDVCLQEKALDKRSDGKISAKDGRGEKCDE